MITLYLLLLAALCLTTGLGTIGKALDQGPSLLDEETEYLEFTEWTQYPIWHSPFTNR